MVGLLVILEARAAHLDVGLDIERRLLRPHLLGQRPRRVHVAVVLEELQHQRLHQVRLGRQAGLQLRRARGRHVVENLAPQLLRHLHNVKHKRLLPKVDLDHISGFLEADGRVQLCLGRSPKISKWSACN